LLHRCGRPRGPGVNWVTCPRLPGLSPLRRSRLPHLSCPLTRPFCSPTTALFAHHHFYVHSHSTAASLFFSFTYCRLQQRVRSPAACPDNFRSRCFGTCLTLARPLSPSVYFDRTLSPLHYTDPAQRVPRDAALDQGPTLATVYKSFGTRVCLLRNTCDSRSAAATRPARHFSPHDPS
jgi:hypothetical protein